MFPACAMVCETSKSVCNINTFSVAWGFCGISYTKKDHDNFASLSCEKKLSSDYFFGSGPGFVNRTQSNPGFVNPGRSGPGFVNPIRSGPAQVLSTPKDAF